MSRKKFEIPEKKVNITTRGRRTGPQGGVREDVEPVQGTGNLSGLIAASWQDATASSSHDKGRMKLEFLFDSLATELRQASVANRTVTQDTVFVRFVGAAHIDRIAGESTGEPLQLRLPWDVWIAHATNQRKGRVYKTREGGVSRSHSAVVLVATTIHVVRPNSKQHGTLAVLAGHRFLVADEDSTIRQFRQHAVRRHVAVSLGFIPHDIFASSPAGLANPRQAQRALLRSASVLVLRLHQSTDETRKRDDEDATTAVKVGAGASGQYSYQHSTYIISSSKMDS